MTLGILDTGMGLDRYGLGEAFTEDGFYGGLEHQS